MSTELVPIPTPATTEQPANTLADVIDQAIVHADTQRAELAEAGGLESLAWGLSQIREVQRKLGILIGLIDADVSKLNRANGGTTEIPGLGVLETNRRSTKTIWDSPALYARLVDRLVTLATMDTDSGEIVGDRDTAQRMAMLMRELLGECIPMTASASWKVTGIKKLGLNPNDYRDTERGPDTTRILGDSNG